MKRYLPKNQKSSKLAKVLRKNMTKEECHLWYDFLNTYEPSFHRQFVILDYIVDFYCPSLKLAIELDGSQHYEHVNMIKDNQRTGALESYGVKVLRYTNIDINQHFKEVCKNIDENIKSRQMVYNST